MLCKSSWWCVLCVGLLSALDKPAASSASTVPVPVFKAAVTSATTLHNWLNRPCEDEHESCADWAREGECENNPRYMKRSCKRACHLCDALPWSDMRGWNEVGLYALRHAALLLDLLKPVCETSAQRQAVAGVSVRVGEAIGTLYTQVVELHRRQGSRNATRLRAALGSVWSSVEEVRTLCSGDDLSPLCSSVELVARGEAARPELSRRVLPHAEGCDLTHAGVRLAGHAEGRSMPLLGLGVWQLDGEDAYGSVMAALRAGIRHIDTAQVYGNEEEVGAAWKASGVPRQELFLATKLSDHDDYGADNVRFRVESQLRMLQTPYLDLYMLHGPLPERQERLEEETWKELQYMQEEGYIRHLGVSNFDVAGLRRISKWTGKGHYIAVVQNKFSVYHQGEQQNPGGEDILQYCRKHDILMVSYSTFNPWPYQLHPLQDEHVLSIAARHNVTAAQVLLRWALQLGTAVIPRSSNPDHVKQNLQLCFRLSEPEMLLLSGLNTFVRAPHNRPALPSVYGHAQQGFALEVKKTRGGSTKDEL